MRRAALVLSVALFGCDNGAQAPDAGARSAHADTPAPAAASAAAVPPADDLDIAPLQKFLKCAVDTQSGPCSVLNKFSPCKAWSASTPSGDGRWIGRATRVEGTKTEELFVVVRAHRVGTAEVAPGQLGVKVAIEELPKSEHQAFDDAEHAIKTLERQDVSPRFNAALDYLKKRSDWNESFASRTVSGQVDVTNDGGAFICQGPKQQLLIVQRSTKHGANADGMYAEVWATTW